MRSLVEDVTAFHRKIGYADSYGCGLSADIIRRRHSYIDEESREAHEAMVEAAERSELSMQAPEVAHMVQELIDLTYVIAGTFVELGIDPEPAWRVVHQANLRKEAAPGGGKAIKPSGWIAPVVPVVPLQPEHSAR